MILGGKRVGHVGQRSGYAGKRHFARNGKKQRGLQKYRRAGAINGPIYPRRAFLVEGPPFLIRHLLF